MPTAYGLLPLLNALTGVGDWPLGRVRLVNFGDIDEGLAVRLTEDVAQLMPHGGPRVMQRLTMRLIELGAVVFDAREVDPRALYPEASDEIEAFMLHALARAASPLAIDLLLDQPRRWREMAKGLGVRGQGLANRLIPNPQSLSPAPNDLARSARLNRLIDPPIVVLAGRPNVGKSTLSNALLGRSMSIAIDMPGATRDYTAGRIDCNGLVVDWHDTPGLGGGRASGDAGASIARDAARIAHILMSRADLLIAMRDADTDWPDLPPHSRPPHLRVINKIDIARPPAEADVIALSAHTGEGVAALVSAVREALTPAADMQSPQPWRFDQRLDSCLGNGQWAMDNGE